MTKPPRAFAAATTPTHADVRASRARGGLLDAYRSRPPYQRNDYLGWIDAAKRDETKQRRLEQMLDELRRGDRYMKMPWRPRRRSP